MEAQPWWRWVVCLSRRLLVYLSRQPLSHQNTIQIGTLEKNLLQQFSSTTINSIVDYGTGYSSGMLTSGVVYIHDNTHTLVAGTNCYLLDQFGWDAFDHSTYCPDS